MLSKEVARALYQEILTGSTSQFEQYAACAFAYFMRYGLKLRERQEHQVAFFDIGNIVHRALELYTRDMISRGEDWGDIFCFCKPFAADSISNTAAYRD